MRGLPASKLALLLFLSTSGFFGFGPYQVVASEHDNRISASIVEDTSLVPGSRFNITVAVSDIGPLPEDLDAWEVRLQLNATLLMIRRVIDGPLLDDIAEAYGQGGLLFTQRSNATAGTVIAQESWLIGPPHPDEAGFTHSGDLVYIEVEVLEFGYTWIGFTDTKLRDVDGRLPSPGFTQIVHRRVDGFFANVPFNLPPVASFTHNPPPGAPIFAGNPVTFDASGSVDLDGGIAEYQWDFGDGTSLVGETDPVTEHVFASHGLYTVILTVTDDDGAANSTSRSLAVAAGNLPPVANFTFTPENPRIGETVRFDASSSYDPEGQLAETPGQPFLWDFGDGSTGGGVIVEHIYVRGGVYTVTLQVEDEAGLRGTFSSSITVSSTPHHDVAIDEVFVLPEGNIVAGQLAQVVVVVENEGTANEDVLVNAYYDGTLIGSQTVHVSSLPSYPYAVAYVVWDTASVAEGEYVVSATAQISEDENLSNNQYTDVLVTILPPPAVTVDPNTGPVGSKVTLTVSGLPSPAPYGPSGRYSVSFDDQLIGNAFVQGNRFQFTFNIPVAEPGPHMIKAVDSFYPLASIKLSREFTVVDTGPLEIGIEAGSFYFQGDTAVATVQVLHRGLLVEPSRMQAYLVFPDGTAQPLTLARMIGNPGLYRVEIRIDSGAPLGTFMIIVDAFHEGDYVDSEGHGVRAFTVKTAWLSPRRIQSMSIFGGVTGLFLVGAALALRRRVRSSKRASELRRLQGDLGRQNGFP